MKSANEQVLREHIKGTLRRRLEESIEERVTRWLEVRHQRIVAGQHFAPASAECLALYRDGYFISTVMVTQSVAEGIFRLVVKRNNVTDEGDRPEVAKHLVDKRIISQECADAFVRIWKSFRNHVHHMNPDVANVPFVKLAKRNITDLATVEKELFAFRRSKEKFIVANPKYWDCLPDGTAPAFWRFDV